MPRTARAEYEPGIHHVFARGNRKQDIYAGDVDRERYLATLARVTMRLSWRCLSYCLMGNHMHLLIETRSPNLGIGMHRLHGFYAQYFNRRHGFSGHLFQDRFEAVPVRTDPQLWITAAYIASNPVDAGLCRKASDWRWSSHAAIVGGRPPIWLDRDRLFSYFGAQGGDPRTNYADFVNAYAKPKRDSPL